MSDVRETDIKTIFNIIAKANDGRVPKRSAVEFFLDAVYINMFKLNPGEQPEAPVICDEDEGRRHLDCSIAGMQFKVGLK
ncbi:MAG: hypothetical protein H6867_02470 [Rhodospirillales bacterium]|nr:hypothetical protein [Rhodospirillales bacterium]MCB9997054.1 hypothetical protein [Rhodospirillales bacterium]